MKILGIVGGIGAGKTTVVSILQESASCFIIGADEIGHKILLKGNKAYQSVIDAFGNEILDENGEIVRSKLGAIVFSDQKKLMTLNKITHPLIYEEVKEQIEWCKTQNKWEYIIIDAALLVEIGLIRLTDYVLGIYADEEIRVERIMKREGYTREEAFKRISKQKKWEELEKVVDCTINNSKCYEKTIEQVKEFLAAMKSGISKEDKEE